MSTPYLSLSNSAAAIDFYRRAFGAIEIERYMDGERVGHAEIRIFGAPVFLADEYPELDEMAGVRSPLTLGGTSLMITLAVDDIEGFFRTAIAAGVKPLSPVKEEHGRRSCRLADPFGHVWQVFQKDTDHV